MGNLPFCVYSAIRSTAPDDFYAFARYLFYRILQNSLHRQFVRLNLPTAKVSSVLVNGVPVKDYEINGYTLTIHYKYAGAKLVTVNTTDGDKTGVIKWHVSYNLSDGYRAYRYYKISDFMATLKLLLSKINFFKELFSKVGIN